MRACVLAKNICSWVGQCYSYADIQKCQEYPYIIFLGWITVPTLLLTPCLLQNLFVEIKAEKKRVKMKVSFWLEWAVNLNVSYLSAAGLQYFSWKRCWIFSCGRQLNCEFNEWLHNKISAQETFKRWRPIWNPMPWIKRPYLVPAQVQGRLCCPMVE